MMPAVSTLKRTLRNQAGPGAMGHGFVFRRAVLQPVQGVAKGWLDANCSWRFIKSAICARCLAMGEGVGAAADDEKQFYGGLFIDRNH